MTDSEADELLIRWGAWSRHKVSIGHSTENIIYRLMKDQEGAGHQFVKPEIAMSKDIEFVESLVAQFRRGIKKAVKLQYIANLPVYTAAKACKCSEEEFTRRINWAIGIVASELDESGILHRPEAAKFRKAT